MPFLVALITSSVTAFLATVTLNSLGGETGSNTLVSILISTLFTLVAIGVFTRINGVTSTKQSATNNNANKPKPQQQKRNKPAAAKQGKAPANDADFETGEVKWFDSKKGFGFIQRENGDEIFVHHRSIEDTGQGRRRLRDGQAVEFRVEETDKGLQAEDVQVLED